ncbi:DNA primase [Streptomyces sp. YC504]|uniref:DNA primase n=1 Tax=Streptomyces mesophilus TaxID=1775132 RepID=A0A6G4XR75_9ACTN|nr:DNA primase [Streptomyces mesophilus]NGO79204.1 DNA primase [Streptomyces mesophilus]
MSDHLRTALDLAASGIPALPLRVGKAPFGNCPPCVKNACGGRPNMKQAGPCVCPHPCHGWAAATTDTAVLTSREWAGTWRRAAAVAYHPAGMRLTVVDLDHADAIRWAQAHLPPTRMVPTTRGQHWIYTGTMPSSHGVRPGVDIKSRMAYVRWLGPGTGRIAPLPDTVRALGVKKPTVVVPQGLAVPRQGEGRACPHRTPAYLERGITMAAVRITDANSAIHNTVYATFLAVLSVHGRCGCLTEAHIEQLFAAAQAKGESPRHCSEAWANARTRLGL